VTLRRVGLAALLAGAGLAVVLAVGPLRARLAGPAELAYHDPDARGAPGRELVLFVVIDALRRDHLGAYGYERPTSPTLDDLTRRGLWLRHMIAHASHTVPATLSLLASQLPSEHGLQYDPTSRSFEAAGPAEIPRVRDELPMLAEQLRAHGYLTAGFVANPWLRRAFGFAQGFDHYVELESRDGAVLSRRARRFLDAHPDERVFLYLHYMDVHNPYHGPSRGPVGFERPPRGRYRYTNGALPGLSPEDLAFTRALYDERIVYMDGHLREWRDHLAGTPRRVTWVVTSDHGDEFFEHGGLGHGTSLYGEQINSFALLVGDAFPPREVTGCSGAIDVVPTLLDGLGLPAAPGHRGRSLLRGRAEDAGCERTLVAELADRRAVLRGGWKVLQGPASEPRFHHVGVEGRIEGRPDEVDPATREALLGALATDAAPPSTPSAGPDGAVPLDARTRERLEALGYLEPGP